jgi:hypothetical protein
MLKHLPGIVALLSALVLAALLPATALAHRLSDRITPFESIAGVNIHSSFAQVEHKLGRPDSRTRSHGKLALLEYYRDGLSFGITRVRGSVSYSLIATSRRYRLPDGLHVGSAEMLVKRRLHGGTCDRIGCTYQDPHTANRSLTITWTHHHVDAIGLYLYVNH